MGGYIKIQLEAEWREISEGAFFYSFPYFSTIKRHANTKVVRNGFVWLRMSSGRPLLAG
jgi:hypothetical protein